MVKHDIKIDDKTKLCVGKISTATNEYIGQITKIKYDVEETSSNKDNNKYLELSAYKRFSSTIEDYTYPIVFKLCS